MGNTKTYKGVIDYSNKEAYIVCDRIFKIIKIKKSNFNFIHDDEVEFERPFAIFHDLQKMIDGYRKCINIAGGYEFLISGHDPKVTDWYPPLAPEFEKRILDLGQSPKK